MPFLSACTDKEYKVLISQIAVLRTFLAAANGGNVDKIHGLLSYKLNWNCTWHFGDLDSASTMY